MMGCVHRPPPICLELRVRSPIEPSPGRIRDAFFDDVGDLTLGLVTGQRWRLRLGPITLLAFGDPAFDAGSWKWPITGGWLARQPGGTLSYGWRDGDLVGVVDGYVPRLPRPVYLATQGQVHRMVTRRFLLQLRGRTPPPGVPAGPVQRIVSSGVDLMLCAGLTALLRPRRRLRWAAALAAVYHLGCWSLTGRTVGALVTGQRLVSVDGSPVAPWQAVLRLAALPLAVLACRAVHDEAAATEVIEAQWTVTAGCGASDVPGGRAPCRR